MATEHILLVDDDAELASYVKEYLEAKSLDVHVCTSGALALAYLERKTPAICVLDVMMPLMDGFELAQAINEKFTLMPFLFLTGQSSQHERIAGLKLGAEDYITKPFSLEELYLRIKNVLKRQPLVEDSSVGQLFTLGSYVYDPTYQTLTNGSEKNGLSDIENKLLKLLVDQLNEPVERAKIMNEIWGVEDEYKSKSLNVYVTKLRKLLAKEERIQIVNLHGKGYKLVCR